MQVPPEQPMGPGGYPRPSGYGQPEKFSGDLVVGIILIVLNAIFSCISLFIVLGGGLLAGGSSALNDELRRQGQTVNSDEAKAAGGILIIAGVIWLILCIVAIVGAVGIIKSAKWGLMLTFILGLLLLIMSVVSFNPIGLASGLFEAS